MKKSLIIILLSTCLTNSFSEYHGKVFGFKLKNQLNLKQISRSAYKPISFDIFKTKNNNWFWHQWSSAPTDENNPSKYEDSNLLFSGRIVIYDGEEENISFYYYILKTALQAEEYLFGEMGLIERGRIEPSTFGHVEIFTLQKGIGDLCFFVNDGGSERYLLRNNVVVLFDHSKLETKLNLAKRLDQIILKASGVKIPADQLIKEPFTTTTNKILRIEGSLRKTKIIKVDAELAKKLDEIIIEMKPARREVPAQKGKGPRTIDEAAVYLSKNFMGFGIPPFACTEYKETFFFFSNKDQSARKVEGYNLGCAMKKSDEEVYIWGEGTRSHHPYTLYQVYNKKH
jgi:hypothetical protein